MADETYSDAAMKTVAHQARILFTALIAEGFTEAQALDLVKTAVMGKKG